MAIVSRLVPALVVVAALAPLGIASAKPTLHFTAREKQACKSEAIRFCKYTYPSKRKLINCLQNHMSSLGDTCRQSLKQGVSERPSVSH